MGLRDFFEDLVDNVKDMVEEFPEFVSDMAELGDELGEVLTEGAKEIVTKGNLDWESSREIRERATSKVGSAKNRYKQKSEQVQEQIEHTQQRIDYRYQREVNLIEALSSTQYSPPSISRKLPDINNYAPKLQLDNFDKVANSLFNSVFGHSIAHEEAEDALNEAHQFEDYVDKKICSLNQIEENMVQLNCLMDEEDRLLDIIQNALRNHASFDCIQIRQQLIALLSEQIFDSKMNVTSGYQICLSNIQNFCRHL